MQKLILGYKNKPKSFKKDNWIIEINTELRIEHIFD